MLLGPHEVRWVAWRCGSFTDRVRQFRAIRDEARRVAGHVPPPLVGRRAWRAKLAIDPKSQAQHLDVFGPMPYHARFGHAADSAWVGRQVAWPIVQLSGWGEAVPAAQVAEVVDQGTRPPATRVTAFNWARSRRTGTRSSDWDARIAPYARETGAGGRARRNEGGQLGGRGDAVGI